MTFQNLLRKVCELPYDSSADEMPAICSPRRMNGEICRWFSPRRGDGHKPPGWLPGSLLWVSLMGLREAHLKCIAAAVPLNTHRTPKLCGLPGVCHRESGVCSQGLQLRSP